MSNFICSECGMTNIDCGRAGYKTPKEIELEKRLEVSEKEHYRTLKQLRIAIGALNNYADEENWRTATTVINTDYFEYECSMYNLKNNGFEEAQKALKEIKEVK